QAEDGIRDWSVTGVQTCALPISAEPLRQPDRGPRAGYVGAEPGDERQTALIEQPRRLGTRGLQLHGSAVDPGATHALVLVARDRSEERRVGKEGRAGRGAGRAKR